MTQSLMILSGLSLAMFSVAWGQGWWYTFDFILATLGLYLGYYVLVNFKSIKNDVVGFIKGDQVKDFITLILSLTVSFAVLRGLIAVIFMKESFFIGFKQLFEALIQQPLWFINIKSVGETTIWPNVLTTVAELNASNFSAIIGALGGYLLFAVGLVGLLLVMLKSKGSDKSYVKFAILIAIWFVASLYAAVTSLRFIALIVPVFSLAFGAGLGLGYQCIKRWMTKSLDINAVFSTTLIVIVFMMILLQKNQ